MLRHQRTPVLVPLAIVAMLACPVAVRAEVSPPQGRTMSYQFAIPAGPLDVVMAAFQLATGIAVTFPPIEGLGAIGSAGVAGTFTAEEGLERLLAGTSVVARLSGPRAYALELRAASERVEVTACVEPYRGDVSAGATKTVTALRDIPQTVSVLPRELLADQNTQSLAGAMTNVPGVTVAQGEGNRDQIVIRGISTASDFFVNGIRDDQERFRDLYNVERIEVVQGPAAVLFGRGGGGGIVNLVTRRPSRGAPADLVIGLGDYGHKRATAQFGGGLRGSADYRVSLVAEDSGGFRDGFFLRRYGVNPVVGVTLGRATTLTVGVEHLYDRRLADRGVPSFAGRPVAVRPGQFFGSLSQNHARVGTDDGYAQFEHRVSSRLTLRNSVLAGRYDKAYQNVYPGSAVSAAGTLSLSAYNHGIDRRNVFNQTDVIYEMRTGGVTHTLLGGSEFGHQGQDEQRHTAATIGGVSLATSVRDANFAAAPLVIDRHATSDVAAAYVQDQVAFGRRWKAVAGARTDRFSVRVDDHLPSNVDLSRSDVATSPRAGLIYQPTSSASIYTSYSYTFLPSGQTLGLAVTTAELKPESASNYEVGSKVDLLSQRLNVSAAVFRLDRNNVKNTDPDDPGRLVLTGQQRTEGLVLSAAGSLMARWKIYGGYSLLRAQVLRDTVAAPAGRAVGLVPRAQGSLWMTYDVSKRWGGGGGIVGRARMFASFSNQVELPGFGRVDGLVYYRFGAHRLSLNVENLLDARYFATANGDNNVSPGAPRSVQLTLRGGF